jgi:glycosyltransferase involved in cell wall biosynthesis
MDEIRNDSKIVLSVVIPCYNEEQTLEKCVDRLLQIQDDGLSLEIVIVDDCSEDKSVQIARDLERRHNEITLVRHDDNQGKGAALRTGFKFAQGHYVAVQDADLEYDPNDLKRLLMPIVEDKADVVLGSRFLSTGAHRVLYFWHSLGNRFLTLLSNMFTDLNLTDMETCYKVFRSDVIKQIRIEENRFGFEPEVVAKVAHMRLRIFEMGISYYGRTYQEGKKIGVKDGFRALYCIFRYNAHRAPLPVQFLIYVIIGGIAGVVNLLFFMGLVHSGGSINVAAPIAFVVAAILNYLLCIKLLFRHKARWNSTKEIIVYWIVVAIVGLIDLLVTKTLILVGALPAGAKVIATLLGLVFNFTGRRFLVFPERSSGEWRPQENGRD